MCLLSVAPIISPPYSKVNTFIGKFHNFHAPYIKSYCAFFIYPLYKMPLFSVLRHSTPFPLYLLTKTFKRAVWGAYEFRGAFCAFLSYDAVDGVMLPSSTICCISSGRLANCFALLYVSLFSPNWSNRSSCDSFPTLLESSPYWLFPCLIP